jgi:hypothetical protein
VAQDDVEAARWFRLVVAQGDVDAQYFLGCFYAAGRSVTTDYVKAEWPRRLADAQGHFRVQLTLRIRLLCCQLCACSMTLPLGCGATCKLCE